MQRSAVQHIWITGACGAGKSTLGRALSRQLQLPLHRLDDDPDFRQLVLHELPESYRWTEPQRYARFHTLRRQLVQEAVLLTQRFCRKFRFWGQNPKTGSRKFNLPAASYGVSTPKPHTSEEL